MLNRKLHGPRPGQIALRAAAMLLVVAALLTFLQSSSEAQGNDKATSNLALSSPNPGELVITWDAPSNAPDDYRLTWKKSDGKWHSYKNANTVEGGNAFPTGTSHTVTGLEEGTGYSARVRSRYDDGNVKQSGPWTATQEIIVASTPLPTKPPGLLAATSHDNVQLLWTNPKNDSITGYQILRGQNAEDGVGPGDAGAGLGVGPSQGRVGCRR